MAEKKAKNIRIFLGGDTKRSRNAVRNAISDLKEINPTALTYRFDDLTFDVEKITEALTNVSIFGAQNIVILDGLCDAEGGEQFYRESEELRESSNTVLIRETDPSKELRGYFKKLGDIEEFALPKVIEKQNSFALADAVAQRDKRAAWVEFSKQKRRGAVMEEVHGIVFWAFKSLYISKVETREGALAAGIKDYTYRTYKPRANAYLTEELEQKLEKLKDIYHDAHSGGEDDLGVALEKFLLKI